MSQSKLQKRGPVACILPRGEAIRNFGYSGALQFLEEHGGCAAISVRPNDEIWRQIEGVCSSVHPLEEFRDRYPTRMLRDLLDIAHGRWLWSEAAKERWRLRDMEATTAPEKLKRWAKKAAMIPFATLPGLQTLSALERLASRCLRPTDHYLRLFEELKPSLVFNGSHVHSPNSIQPVQAAQWLGIPTATFIFSWDNLTSQGRVIPSYDYYLVWNNALRDQLLEIYPGVRPDQVRVTGTPQFDSHFLDEFKLSREAYFARVGADPRRPLVFYATGMDNHMPGEDLIVEQIADLLASLGGEHPPQLMVRIYAKDRSGRFEPLRRRRPDILFPKPEWETNWLTPKREDAFLLSNTLRHCAFGLNVASTVSLELCMFDKPVINIGYNPPNVPESVLQYSRYYLFDHYKPVIGSGAVQLARNPEELRTLVVDALANPSRHSSQRRALLASMFGPTLDGRSGRRAAEVLVQLADETSHKRTTPGSPR